MTSLRAMPRFFACLLISALAALVLTTCTNPMLDTVQAVVTGYQRPTATIDFATGSGLAADTVITVTFSETMNPNSLVIGGGLAEHADAGTWTQTTVPNDTLTIAPASTWPSGSGQTLTVDAADPDTYDLETLEVTYGVLEGIVYVHASQGSNSYPGTIDQPKRSIAAGVSAAERVYETAEVRVAGGTYQVTNTTTVSDSISLYGGYNPDNWAIRDPGAYETSWLNIRTSGTHETLYYSPSVSSPVTLDGFTISAGNGSVTSDGTAVVFVSGATVTMNNNTFVTGIAQRAYGVSAQTADVTIGNNEFETNDLDATVNCIYATDSDVQISDNTFTGEFVREFYGILLEDTDGVIERNVVNAGQPLQLAQCVSIDGGAVTIRNNVISAGDMLTATVIGQYGVYLNNCTATLHNNTIDGGSGDSLDGIMATAIMLFFQVTSTIENNVIFTGVGGDELDGHLATGVWQRDAASFPTAFNNNVMFGCADGNYYDESNNTGYRDDIVDFDTFLSNGGLVGPFSNAFETGGGLTAAPEFKPVPALNPPVSIKTGGKDLSLSFTDDIEGTSRGAWSAGAYEY